MYDKYTFDIYDSDNILRLTGLTKTIDEAKEQAINTAKQFFRIEFLVMETQQVKAFELREGDHFIYQNKERTVRVVSKMRGTVMAVYFFDTEDPMNKGSLTNDRMVQKVIPPKKQHFAKERF